MDRTKHTTDAHAEASIRSNHTPTLSHPATTDDKSIRGLLNENETMVVPIVAETLDISHHQIETGRVQIIKIIEERQENVVIPSVFSEAQITRIPIARLIEGAVPTVEQRGDTLVVPVVEEVLVTEKRLMLREEVHITLQRRETSSTEPVTLRREVVTIHREDSSPQEDTERP